jgi:drug/metabolite transporter (DMT)-like permease
MSALLATLSSLLWGSADFLGGHLSKRFKAFAVTGASQAFGLATALIMVTFSGGWVAPSLHNYFLPGVAAGILGFCGLISYYSGLATGQMGVVAPISSLSAVIPLVYAFSRGESPRMIQTIGMVIALIGGFCASGPQIVQGLPIKPLLFGLGAALGFGSALVFMARGSAKNPLMTMTMMRLSTVSICVVVAIVAKTHGGFATGDLPTLIAIGVMDFLANYFLGVATTKGLLSIAMVLGSLFPIVTSLLAFTFLKERLHPVQYAGVAFAVLGVACISL